jgi:hypothetical protein
MRPRFSLRFLFTWITVLSIVLGLTANFYFGLKRDIALHGAACERLRALNIHVSDYYDHNSPNGWFTVKSYARRWIDDRAYPAAGGLYVAESKPERCERVLKAARGLRGLDRLTIKTPQLSAETVNLLAERRDLQSLHLILESLAPGAAEKLPQLASLENLTIEGPISADFAKSLSQCRALRLLTLRAERLTPQCYRALEKIPGLEQVTIHGQEIAPELVEAVTSIGSLSRLSIANCTLTRESLAALAQAQTLESISIWDECNGPSELLAEVAQTPHLQVLTIARNADSPRFDLAPLKGQRSIREIYITGMPLSGAELQLLLSLPQLETLSFTAVRGNQDRGRFLVEEAKLRLISEEYEAEPIYEGQSRQFRLKGDTLRRISPDGSP